RSPPPALGTCPPHLFQSPCRASPAHRNGAATPPAPLASPAASPAAPPLQQQTSPAVERYARQLGNNSPDRVLVSHCRLNFTSAVYPVISAARPIQQQYRQRKSLY